MRHLSLAVSACIAFAPTVSAQASSGEGVAITFLANEGVMLSGGGKKVLIDGLFLKYKTDFALPAESTQVALQAARAPFDGVDAILVTHRHGDHFHPQPMAAHLRANPRATLVTSSQVIDSLRGRLAAGDVPASRLMARTTPIGGRQRVVVNGIAIELLGFKHSNVEHLGYIVEIGGRRVLHVGDTDDAESVFPQFRLDTARIDVALLPSWMMGEKGRRVIERWIRPKQVVAFHFGPNVSEEQARRTLQGSMPGTIAFIRSLETRRW